MKPFLDLSRRGRLFRLKEVAATALPRFDLDDARLRFIQYHENTIYRVDVPGPIPTHHSIYLPNRYVLRIHAINDSEMVASELTWLTAMDREGACPYPHRFQRWTGNCLHGLSPHAFRMDVSFRCCAGWMAKRSRKGCERGTLRHSAKWQRGCTTSPPAGSLRPVSRALFGIGTASWAGACFRIREQSWWRPCQRIFRNLLRACQTVPGR